MKNIIAAVIQNKTNYDKKANITHALELIKRAADNGAQLITLPEIFYYPYELLSLRKIADTDQSTILRLQNIASKWGIYLCTGSLAIKEKKNIRNTSFLIGPTGDILISYSKTHLFDVHFQNLHVKESVVFTPGENLALVHTPIGTIGLLICYDIRFPELSRTYTLKGAEILIVPAAFNLVTGPAHWHILFRTRAMENQVFLLAASQARVEGSPYTIYGHSLIVDPWGTIKEDAGTAEKIIYSDLKSEDLINTRKRMPLLEQRLPGLYDI